MKIFIQRFFILFFLMNQAAAFAQTYPVQLTTQLVPPYSGYLPDYASPGSEKLHIIVLLKDLTKPIYTVRLVLKIEGSGFTLQTKSFYKCPPVTIEPGVPVEVNSDILAQLLDSKNLDFNGISKSDYEKRKALPEGYYKICLTAYDYYNPNNIVVSNESCASAWMTLSDPPQLNFPACENELKTNIPQQITFSWTPMNMGSMNSAGSTEYLFELWEIRPDGANPNNIVQTIPPVYSVTTDFSTLNYGITEPPLNAGMQYAWRVRAIDKSGADLFKNKGYSAVCTFRYGSKYEGMGDALKLNLQAIPLTARIAKFVWDSIAVYDHYSISYRKQGALEWFENTTSNSSSKAYDLEPLTTYEAQVQGTASDGFIGPVSNLATFKTPALSQYGCGDALLTGTQQNIKPLVAAWPGMIFQVGQFEMKVNQIHGSNGFYSGLGSISVPFWYSAVGVSFSSIFVNEDHVMVMGEVKALTEGMDKWLATGTMKTGQDTTDSKVNFTIKDIKADTSTGTITITGSTGETTTVSYSPPDEETIKDKDGNIYDVDGDGNVKLIGKSGKGKGAVPAEKNVLNTSQASVKFSPSAKQKYGYDSYQYIHLNNYYTTIKDLGDSAHRQIVNWKSIETAKMDLLTAEITTSKINKDSIFFITGTGTIYYAKRKGSTCELTVIGGPDKDGQELFAAYRKKDSIIYIGKVDLAGYKKINHKLVLVPLGKDLSADKEKIQTALNTVYTSSVVQWDVDIAPTLIPDSTWDSNHDNKISIESGMLSKYSKEMNNLNKQLRKQPYYDGTNYYLLVSYYAPDSVIAGLMPRGYHIGYLFNSSTGNQQSQIALAHELAHGAFNLSHPFDEFTKVIKGSTDNLLDYNGGTALNKYQWDAMRDPASLMEIFDGDEKAEMDDYLITGIKLLGKIKSAYLNGKSFSVPKEQRGLTKTFKNICIEGISYENFTIYVEVFRDSVIPKNNIETDAVNSQLIINHAIYIRVPKSRLTNMEIYLKSTLPRNNLLLFVNGYRNYPSPDQEFPKPPDVASAVDVNNYWEGIDISFSDKIGTRNIVYADGHHSITTSNHKSKMTFLTSMISSGLVTSFNGFLWNQNLGFIETDNVLLDTDPNKSGFTEREANGLKAGDDFINKLNDGTFFCRKDGSGKIIDTIDIVAHSMGYAYSLGIINKLIQNNIHIGNFYVLAPENACSGYLPAQYESVWQYGSDETNDAKWLQDGIAPQCPINGMDRVKKGGRVRIPASAPHGFLDCHYVTNYTWIFNRQLGQDGYIKKR